MSKIITNDNLKAYHEELAEHIKLLQRNTTYALNDIVNYDGLTLKCTTAGTTDTTRPNISTLSVGSTYTDGTCVWTRIDLDKRGIDYYVASKDYVVDDQVIYDNKIYKCITAHTSTSTFDTTKWAEISAGGGGGISVWQANTEYAVNDVVIDSNLIWQCATSHTSTTTFDESKWICISGGEISNGMEIVPLWEGEFSFDNSTQGAAPTSSTPMIELSDSISNFEYIRIFIRVEQADKDQASNLGYVPYLINNGSMRCGMLANDGTFATCEAKFYDSTRVFIRYRDISGWASGQISRIEGIRKAKPIVSSGMKYETLWEGEAGDLNSSFEASIQLSDVISKYSKLGLELKARNPNNSNDIKTYYQECSTSQILSIISNNSGQVIFTMGYSSWTDHCNILSSSTLSNLSVEGDLTVVTKIIGISEGVVISTGIQAARVTLWEGSYNTSNESESNLINTITLNDSITNYDCVEITFAGSGSRDNIVTEQYDVSNYIVDNYAIVSFGHSSMYADMNFKFVDDTHFAIMYKRNSTWDGKILKIVGIKYIQPDSYSTEEKLIGTWIDGKPLYRKVFTGLNISLNWNGDFFAYKGDISLPINNIDTIVKSIGYGTDFCMPVTLQLNSSNNLFSIRGVDVWTINKLVIEYTKN